MPILAYHAPITTRDRTSEVWTRWLKSVGQQQVTAQTAQRHSSNSNVNYVLNGINCTVVYHDPNNTVTTDETLKLPYTALLAFSVGTTVYPAGTKEIVIPGASTFLSFSYQAKLQGA